MPELGQIGEERAAHNRTDAGHRAKQVLLGTPDRTPLDGVVQVAIDGGDTALEPADMAYELSTDGHRRMFEPITLGRQHVEELPAARDQGSEVLEDRIRKRAGCGVHPFGKEREEDAHPADRSWRAAPVALAKSRT